MFYKHYVVLSRRKISFFVIPLLIISVVFILYQINIFLKLSEMNHFKKVQPILIRGSHYKQASSYRPNSKHNFICLRSQEEIPFSKINDNYCDCLDGSDEPGTNACSNGHFYCEIQIAKGHYPLSISSSLVNDGICDCCDGSDEWDNNHIFVNFTDKIQQKADRYYPPCPKMC